MDSEQQGDLGAPEPKGRRRRARQNPGAKAAEAGKRSLNLRIDEDTYERLHVHALRRRGTVSDLVMELAKAHLREFSIHRTGTRTEQGEGA